MSVVSRVRPHRASLALATILVVVAVSVPAVASAAASTPTAAAAAPMAASVMAAMPVSGTPAEAAVAAIPLAGNGLLFKSPCTPSHILMDDPIVFPGQPGASHEHVFFGNVTTDSASTLATLADQPSTCRIPGDHAAYWVPSLQFGAQMVLPRFANAYYLADGARGHVVAFPAGLKVIAGDSHATTAQSTSILGWKCANRADGVLSPTPIACAPRVDQVLVIRFPDCWNGHDLDSVDHKSHLAYRNHGVCPAGYPVALPRLSFNVHYRLPSLTGLTLASGSIYSAHADFFNAWNQTVLARLVARNLN